MSDRPPGRPKGGLRPLGGQRIHKVMSVGVHVQIQPLGLMPGRFTASTLVNTQNTGAEISTPVTRSMKAVS